MLIQKPYRVVVVDDDPSMLAIIRAFLIKDKELEVITFSDPNVCFEYITKNSINILISDIIMDEMYGDDLLRKVLNLKQGIQVIMMTANKSLVNFQACHNGGAKCVMFKPINKLKLEKIISKIKENFDHWNSKYQEIASQRK